MRQFLAWLLAFWLFGAHGQEPVFEPFAWQAPENGGLSDATVANPRVRPMLAPGTPAPIATAQLAPIDTRGIGRPDVFACHLSLVPYPKTRVPCRMFRPQEDGSLVEISTQVFGDGPLPTVQNPRGIVVADFNGDGLPDIFVSDHGYDAPPFEGATNLLLVSRGDGSYADRSSTLPQEPDFSHSACAGDVDGDGHVDIYVNNQPQASAVTTPYFLLGNGDGTFRKSLSGLPAALVNYGEIFMSCRLADMDGDGHPDLVLGRSSSDSGANSRIYYNDGHGRFDARTPSTLPLGPLGENALHHDLIPLDVDRDGRNDLLVISSRRANDEGFALQVLINAGNGTFRDESASRLPIGSSRSSGLPCYVLRMLDLDRDGWPDLVCERQADPETLRWYWLGAPGGTWRFPSSALPSSQGGANLLPVDFDGDGRPDLLRFTNDGAGEIRYRSFRNVTPRREDAPNHTSLWWNAAESGWGVNFNHQGDFLFGTLFTYDDRGDPLWLVMSAGRLQTDAFTFRGDLYRTTGARFDTVPFPPLAAADIRRVGWMQVAFQDSDRAILQYTFEGQFVTKAIRRQVYGTRPANCRFVSGSRAGLAHYQDLWWVPSESGWGVNVTQQDQILFATLFTYDAARRATWYVLSNGSRQANGSYLGALHQVRGPPFNAVPFTPITGANLTEVGTMRLSFSDGERGSLDYSINGTRVVKSIVRQVFSSPVPACN